MDGFLRWFFEFMQHMIDGLWSIISGFFGGLLTIFNFPFYFKQFNTYKGSFTPIDWIFSIVAFLIVMAIWVIVFWMLYLVIRKYLRFRHTQVGSEDLLQELADMHRDVMRLTREKERIMALKFGETNIPMSEINNIIGGDENYDGNLPAAQNKTDSVEENIDAPIVSDAPIRFNRLNAVDNKYMYYAPPEYENNITLEQLCDNFRNFACHRMGLFYEKKVIRLLFSGLATTKLILLQGISGTGKTSLPYAMGKFFQNDTTIVSVQPSWRDRTEMFGFFNEFTKRFNETEMLKRIYEANYNDDINVIILDEMNIARIEYYFAEMLSIMEMPDPNEWTIELVASPWDTDPKKLDEGKLHIPQNVWYIGTANNDDSTYAVSDKVYDRALTISIDTKAEPFDAPDTPPALISFSFVESLYKKAVEEHPLDEKYLDDIAKLDNYIVKKFRVAFGNRIMKQLKTFVPVYVACGGDVLEGIDHIMVTKVFRKFENLNLALFRDEIKGLINYMNSLFGVGKMSECIAFLERLQKAH